MVSNGFRIFGYMIGLMALYAMWLDLSVTDEPSKVLGQFWFEHHAASLQITEAVISRYVDPCGLIVPLGCEPFLWHPVLVTVLGWPTAPVSYTHLRAHETLMNLVCRLLLEKKKA